MAKRAKSSRGTVANRADFVTYSLLRFRLNSDCTWDTTYPSLAFISNCRTYCNAVTAAFPEYCPEVFEQDGVYKIVINRTPYGLVTDTYTGPSILDIQSIHDLYITSRDMLNCTGKKLTRDAMLRQMGFTERGYIELCALFAVGQYIPWTRLKLEINFTAPPTGRVSHCKFDIHVERDSEEKPWYFTVNLPEDCNQDEYRLAAQELQYAGVKYNAQRKQLYFDTFPVSLAGG